MTLLISFPKTAMPFILDYMYKNKKSHPVNSGDIPLTKYLVTG